MSLVFAGQIGPHADDADLAKRTEAAIRILDAACDDAASQIGPADAILNALLSLWVNHSVRVYGLDATLTASGLIEDLARHCAARNLQ